METRTQLVRECIKQKLNGISTMAADPPNANSTSDTHLFSEKGDTLSTSAIWYKQWKVQRDHLENLPYGGPESNQTFLRGTVWKESLITRGTSCGQIFPDNPEFS